MNSERSERTPCSIGPVEQKLVGGRYEIVRKIAEGGMGEVFEARHHMTKKTIALKVLFPHIGKNESSRQRFLREVSAPAQIGHDGIVDVLDSGVDTDGSLFVAMEMLQGDTVREWLDRGGHDRDAILDLFDRVFDPLAAAHSRGIVHRDLKPENVFLHETGKGTAVVKILDFGIARDLDTSQDNVTKTGIAMGTPHYMAPEQAMSAKGVTAAADIWALGAMMFEALTGRTPFDGETPSAIVVHACTQPHPPVRQLVPDLDPRIADLVDRCLAKEPSQRPPDAGALQRELRAARPGRSAPSAAMPAPAMATPLTREGDFSAGYQTGGGGGGGFGTGPTSGPFGGPTAGSPPSGGAPTGGTPGGAFGGVPSSGTQGGPTQGGAFGGGTQGGGTQGGGTQGGGTPGGGTQGGAFGGMPSSGPQQGGAFGGPTQGGFGGPAGATPGPGPSPMGPTPIAAASQGKSNTGLYIGIGAVALLLLVGGGVAAFALGRGEEAPPPTPGGVTDPAVAGGAAAGTAPAATGGQGTVSIVTPDGGGELLVDGTSQGPIASGGTVQLAAGSHLLQLRRAGSIVGSAQVTVPAGGTVSANLTALAATAALPGEEVRQGTLAAGDRTLNSGEFQDQYTFQWTAGSSHHVEVRSTDFDTYLIVRSPSGQQQDNDDMTPGQGTNAGLDVNVSETGTWTVIVTSYQAGESGSYQLSVR